VKTVTIEEVLANLPRLLERIEAGEEVVITRAGRWVAALTPPPPPPPTLEEVAERRARAENAVRSRLQALLAQNPVLGDGTPLQPFLDLLERAE
jgi:antitoxin (DNA-binding transcriptional repressor) of toxin-antitoxin stability system